MNSTYSLPVIMPEVANQRWACHSCGNCCRTLVGHISEDERRRLDEQHWADRLGLAPYVRLPGGWALNKHEDGACVFLTEDNRCRIHSEYGESFKPFACRVFPFSVRRVPAGWQASLRFDCPSVVASKGRPLDQYLAWLRELVPALGSPSPDDEAAVDLQRGLAATPDELERNLRRFAEWFGDDQTPVRGQLTAAARVITTLASAKLKNVRQARLAELVDLLFAARSCGAGEGVAAPTGRQCGLLRQLAFAHAEHVTLTELRSGFTGRLLRRLRQLRDARRFLIGRGPVPLLLGFAGHAGFEAIESVEPASDRTAELDDLLRRYVSARLLGRSVFGPGFYGWSVIEGLTALCLSVAAVGWLARYAAALDGRPRLGFEDLAHALGVVDRAATRLPALGTLAERARVSYLLRDDGVARLLEAYAWHCGP